MYHNSNHFTCKNLHFKHSHWIWEQTESGKPWLGSTCTSNRTNRSNVDCLQLESFTCGFLLMAFKQRVTKIYFAITKLLFNVKGFHCLNHHWQQMEELNFTDSLVNAIRPIDCWNFWLKARSNTEADSKRYSLFTLSFTHAFSAFINVSTNLYLTEKKKNNSIQRKWNQRTIVVWVKEWKW